MCWGNIDSTDDRNVLIIAWRLIISWISWNDWGYELQSGQEGQDDAAGWVKSMATPSSDTCILVPTIETGRDWWVPADTKMIPSDWYWVFELTVHEQVDDNDIECLGLLVQNLVVKSVLCSQHPSVSVFLLLPLK